MGVEVEEEAPGYPGLRIADAVLRIAEGGDRRFSEVVAGAGHRVSELTRKVDGSVCCGVRGVDRRDCR